MATQPKNHRTIINDVVELTEMSRIEIFESALLKHTGGQDQHISQRAVNAYYRFEWNGQAPEWVIDYCLSVLVPPDVEKKPRIPIKKIGKARKLRRDPLQL